ncbi:MAG: hypothetical protein WCK89_10105 [bacterium]
MIVLGIWSLVHCSVLGMGSFCPTATGRLEQSSGSGSPGALKWQAPLGTVVVNQPELTVGQQVLGVTVKSRSIKRSQATFLYQVNITECGVVDYTVNISAVSGPGGPLLLCRTALSAAQPLKQDLRVSQSFELAGRRAAALVTEQCRANVDEAGKTIFTQGMRTWRIGTDEPASAHFDLGIESTDLKGPVISMPLVALAFRGENGSALRLLSIATDPYCGAQFYASQSAGTGPGGDARVAVVTRYKGSLVPIRSEARTLALQFSEEGADGMFRAFYATIPEIKPGADWIHGVAMNYYDYFSDGGKGWYRDIEKLAQVVPKEYRGKVVCCLHGWYDGIGKYCFDPKTGKMADEWKVFGQHPNSKAEMYRRIAFAKERGFRVILYFADGTNSPKESEFHKGMIFMDQNRQTRGGWLGPDFGGGPYLDAANPAFRAWYRAYLEALLKEYGREIDGLVYDETNYMRVGDVSFGGPEPAYADRSMMTLVSELAQVVQEWRKVNPGLVFLEGSHYYYGLVAHGSYTDWPGLPLAINYRNASWQCLWDDPGVRNVHCRSRTDPNVDYPYGLDIGLTDGWGKNRGGPAKMPREILDEVIQRFMQRVKEGPQQPKIKTITDPDRLL